MTPHLPHRPRPRSGFTLVELVVAVGLTSIMLWGILQLFSSATRFSSTITAQAELCSSARAVLDRIVREVQSAAPLDVGYVKITTGDTDTIQFVGLITHNDGDGVVTERGHIRFSVDSTTGMIERTTQFVDSLAELKQHTTTFDSSLPTCTSATFGLEVEGFRVRYIPSVDPNEGEELHGDVTFHATENNTIHVLPMALVFELTCRDPRGLTRITLTSSAPLLASGL